MESVFARAILIFTIFLTISTLLSFFIYQLLHSANFKQENFQKNEVVTSAGVLFFFFNIFYAAFLLLIGKSVDLNGWPYSILLIGFGMVVLGFIDDMFGDRQESGFRGHFGALAKGKITTGLVKAVIGLVLSIIVAFLASGGIIEILVNSLIIALCINFFNLLDLRPGRSLKMFLFSSLLILSFSQVTLLWYISIPIFAPVFVLLFMDLQMYSMLGDAGSNFLGAIIGVWLVYSFGLKVNLAVLLFLIVIHLYSEKHSISKFISQNTFFNWLDNLGLRKQGSSSKP